MKQTLILYLHAENPWQASWILLDEFGKIKKSAQNLPLDNTLFTEKFSDTSVIVITPAQDVLLMHVMLPKLNRQRLIQALPFALEEKLIDDVTNLHFAIGDYQPDNTLPVAIVAKQKMENWLNAVKQAGISPQIFTPATLILPISSDDQSHWCGFIYDDIAVMRMEKYTGLASDAHNFIALLDLQLAESKNKPQQIDIYNFSNNPLPKKINDVTINEIDLSEKDFLPRIAEWSQNNPAINLLQGSFQAKPSVTISKKIWLFASIAAAAWLGIAFFSNLISFFMLHHAANKIESSIQTIYQQNFPAATAIIAPKERMEEKLSKLTGAANNNNFLYFLGIIGDSLFKQHGVRLLNLDFRNNLLSTTISATNFENLDAFTKALKQYGLSVKQQNAAVEGAQVKATLLISKGAL